MTRKLSEAGRWRQPIAEKEIWAFPDGLPALPFPALNVRLFALLAF